MKHAFSSMLISISTILAVQPAIADTTYFYSIPEAEQHCPLNTTLIFKPNNSTVVDDTGTAYSAGTVYGMSNTTAFVSTSNGTQAPKNLGANNVIADAQFHATQNAADGASQPYYGYISNNITTCFYSYAGAGGYPNVSVAFAIHAKTGG